MNSFTRILGTFTAAAAMGLAMGGCEGSGKDGVQQQTPQGTKVTVYPSAHLVRERVTQDLVVGADFKQNFYFKTMIYSGNYASDEMAGTNACVTTTLQIPFVDIKDQETLNKIAYLKTFYDQATSAPKPAVVTPAPAPK